MFYIGFRVEVASRMMPSNLSEVVEQYNDSNSSQIINLQQQGKITVDKSGGMVIARGNEDNGRPGKNGAMVNFAIVSTMESAEELTRVVQIINVLGNGRLIRERVKTFMDEDSTLNQLPELECIKTAIKDAEKLMPGLVRGGWYYAPEAYFDDE